jgi:hypothetical protein
LIFGWRPTAQNPSQVDWTRLFAVAIVFGALPVIVKILICEL